MHTVHITYIYLGTRIISNKIVYRIIYGMFHEYNLTKCSLIYIPVYFRHGMEFISKQNPGLSVIHSSSITQYKCFLFILDL